MARNPTQVVQENVDRALNSIPLYLSSS